MAASPLSLVLQDLRRFVFLRDAVGMAAVPIAVGTRNNVRKTDLARNQIAIRHDRSEDAKKRGLVPGQQETSRLEKATLWTPARNSSAFARTEPISHDDHFQSSLDNATKNNTVARSG